MNTFYLILNLLIIKCLKRDDLKWIRNQYLMLLQFAWDDTWYDVSKQKITFDDHFFKYDSLTGGWDIFTLWPTWPRLGLDERNQFDMYRDFAWRNRGGETAIGTIASTWEEVFYLL